MLTVFTFGYIRGMQIREELFLPSIRLAINERSIICTKFANKKLESTIKDFLNTQVSKVSSADRQWSGKHLGLLMPESISWKEVMDSFLKVGKNIIREISIVTLTQQETTMFNLHLTFFLSGSVFSVFNYIVFNLQSMQLNIYMMLFK